MITTLGDLNPLSLLSWRNPRNIGFKDEADYKRQLAEWDSTLALIGHNRLGSQCLRIVQRELAYIRNAWFTYCLLSLPVPRMIHKLGQMHKEMPAQGGNVIRMRRYSEQTPDIVS